MASQDWLKMRNLAAEERLLRKGNDAMVVLRLKDIAGGTDTPTVVMSDTSSDITITDSNGDVTTCDLSAAAYNTVGEVADYLNSADGWECRVLDALRSDASNDVWPNGSVTASTSAEGEVTFDVTSDSSALASYRLCVAYDRLAGGSAMSNSHRVILKRFQYYADLTAATGGIKIYQRNAAGTETQIFSAASVDTTDTEHDLNNGVTPGEGSELIIAVDSTVVNSASGYIWAQYLRE